MSTLYLECNSGISGDMTVAALLDLGADRTALERGLGSLNVSGYDIRIGRREKGGIDACSFDVLLHDDHDHTHSGGHSHDPSHSHDHAHSHSDDAHAQEAHDHNHSHAHGDHSHTHEDSPHDHGHSHDHVHRNLNDILQIIQASGITDRAKALSARIFRIVADAEAKAHGVALDQVHFHEVGAVDSIVDIVGVAICLDSLDVTQVYCTPLSEGTGTVRCQHGVMPVPAPATMEICRAHGIPLNITDNRGEMVTPTGAAIVAAIAEHFSTPPAMIVEKTGLGAGKKDFKTANLLRASLIDTTATSRDEEVVVKLECNLDDMTGELLADACGQIFAAGALDVWCTPILMKKGRPAQMLSALARPEKEQVVTKAIFMYTTTIGVRSCRYSRTVMARRAIMLHTPWGDVEAKESRWGKICKIKAEYESAKKLSGAENIPVNEILRAAYNDSEPHKNESF